MTDLVSLLFNAMIPIDCKITNFLYACMYNLIIMPGVFYYFSARDICSRHWSRKI